MAYYFLGIDIGTSACKCTVIDAVGANVLEAVSGYGIISPNPGWSEQHPEEWYSSVLRTLGKIAGANPDVFKNISAIGLTGQMRGIILIGDKGKVLRNSILWNDNRCDTEAREIRESHSELIQAVTRNPMNTMCSLPKLLWVMRHEPDIWRDTKTIIYPKDYLAYRLTGNLHTDHSDASGSSLYDLAKRSWSPEILDLFSISPKKLPDIYSSMAIAGKLMPQVARETGLREGIPVVAGGSDAVTELFSAGISTPHQCKLRLGSSGALSTAVQSLDDITGTMQYCWSYIEPDAWMIDINTRSCAQAVEWLGRVFYGPQRDIGNPELIYSIIEKDASSVSAGADGLFFHPYLMGEDAPYWNPDLRASFWGITSRHSRSHFARALLEGTAYALLDARSAMGKTAEQFEEYLFVGGGVKNMLWVSIIADVLGVDAVIQVGSSASVGAAMLAGIGAGAFKNPEDALKKCKRNSELVKCNIENHSLYKLLFEKYKGMKLKFDSIY